MPEIVKVIGREILDSRGNPTVEADVWLAGGHTAGCEQELGDSARFAGPSVFRQRQVL